MPDAMSAPDPHPPAPQPLLIGAATGACPRCGAKTLFSGPVRFAASCRSCGLDYGQFNVGDGPAAFLTLIIGALMVAMALILELKVHPPLWLHLLLWTPLTVAAVIGSLRVAKGALLILEYHNKAREGRLIAKDREA
ncbi:DUF983 domain-containing protein [Sphingobium sp. JS3065]|jgi:uncharacterized protein (DUF983 family)|uniref:DUF983 domain-containing protein n=1 Tax=Sphingobium sp. JS3065 TaxID=2970925 RepID=UPI0022640BB2|nr:DUF983 domain-containing protein [Sphingobium sp. JS3065]UZW54810.1 DUF983 domain-containing protein [Sphingobium sp. JS3065]